MLTENHITELFVKYLEKNNFKSITYLNTKQKGFDITALTQNGQRFFAEVKGETSANENSKRYGQYFTGNQIWSHGAVALFATLRSMNKPEYKDAQFAMVFPMNHEPMMLYIKDSMDKLGIQVFFVSEEEVRIL
jgi:hypothetical protein